MQNTLLVSGIACIIAAIVGGGLKAFSFEIPVLKSGIRQASLGMLGAILVVTSIVVGPGTSFFSSNGDPNGGISTDTSSSDTSRSIPKSDVPQSDFSGGSRRVYSVDFSEVSASSSSEGAISHGFGKSLVLEPSSNTWLGPDRAFDITGVDGDFLCDLSFSIEERNPAASLTFSLEGSGRPAKMVKVYFSVLGDGRANYSLQKGIVKYNGVEVPHAVIEDQIADQEQLPSDIAAHDWSSGSKLRLKRVGGKMQFFVEDKFVKKFDVSLFPVGEVSLGAAQDSKIEITSIEFREPQ